jgi:hypothetical protein
VKKIKKTLPSNKFQNGRLIQNGSKIKFFFENLQNLLFLFFLFFSVFQFHLKMSAPFWIFSVGRVFKICFNQKKVYSSWKMMLKFPPSWINPPFCIWTQSRKVGISNFRLKRIQGSYDLISEESLKKLVVNISFFNKEIERKSIFYILQSIWVILYMVIC